MNKLYKAHLISLVIYILGIPAFICIYVILNSVCNLQIPSAFLAIATMICPIASGCNRLYVWVRRKYLLDANTLSSFSAKISFILIPMEFSFALLGLLTII